MSNVHTEYEIKRLEKELIRQIVYQLESELDWSDFMEVVELVLGNTQEVISFRNKLNDFYGLELRSMTGEINNE